MESQHDLLDAARLLNLQERCGSVALGDGPSRLGNAKGHSLMLTPALAEAIIMLNRRHTPAHRSMQSTTALLCVRHCRVSHLTCSHQKHLLRGSIRAGRLMKLPILKARRLFGRRSRHSHAAASTMNLGTSFGSGPVGLAGSPTWLLDLSAKAMSALSAKSTSA